MVTVGTSSVRGYTGHCMDAALDDGQCAIVTMPVSGYQPFLKVTLAGSDDVSPDKTPPIKCDPDDKVCNEINKALDAAVGLGIGMLILLIGGSITLVIILIITIYCCCKGKCPCWKRNRAAPAGGRQPLWRAAQHGRGRQWDVHAAAAANVHDVVGDDRPGSQHCEPGRRKGGAEQPVLCGRSAVSVLRSGRARAF